MKKELLKNGVGRVFEREGSTGDEGETSVEGATVFDDNSGAEFERARALIEKVEHNYVKHVVGQERLRESLLISLLTGGHLLIESVPGLAKTTAATTLASSAGGVFSRIQCTPDLLPSDIVGTEVFDQRSGKFKIELGPVHSNFVLLDEINRASAKTQSAMLEAMQEKQTSIGGVSYKLPTPFFVIATQNPIEHEGTYPLPEAQLDRFLIKDELNYLTPTEELILLRRHDTRLLYAESVESVVSLDEVKEAQRVVAEIFVSESVRKYIVNLVHSTRVAEEYIPSSLSDFIEFGASARATLSLLVASRAHAFLMGRRNVLPEDVKHVALRVLRHRLILRYDAALGDVTSDMIIEHLLGAVPTP